MLYKCYIYFATVFKMEKKSQNFKQSRKTAVAKTGLAVRCHLKYCTHSSWPFSSWLSFRTWMDDKMMIVGLISAKLLTPLEAPELGQSWQWLVLNSAQKQLVLKRCSPGPDMQPTPRDLTSTRKRPQSGQREQWLGD